MKPSLIKYFIETHFNMLLLLACLTGFILPGLDRLPDQSATVVLALLMFVSCYKLADGGFHTISWPRIARFYCLRYMLLPPLLWAAAHALTPAYATGVFLLSVLPAAVSSPAFANIYGGSVPPAFAIAILSQLGAPFLIPAQFALIGNMQVAPSPSALFITMTWCIFLPVVVYAVIRHHKPSSAYMYRQTKFFSMLLVAFVIALVIAKQRSVILTSGPEIIASFAIALLCFFLYILVGWWLARRAPEPERITYATCSSFNNAALGVSLALLHFTAPVILFVAVSEIAWALLPFMFRQFLNQVHL